MALAQALRPSLLRSSQEQAWPFAIDWNHPEAVGLEEFIIAAPVGLIDLVSGEIGTRSGSGDPGQVNELGGVDAYFDGADDQYTLTNNPAFDSSQDFTVVWECVHEGFTTDTTQVIVSYYSASGGAARLVYSSAVASNLAMIDGATLLGRFAKPDSVSLTERHWGVWSYAAAVGHSVWINGEDCPTNGTGSFGTRPNSHRVGGSDAVAYDFNGAIRQARRYSRAWSKEEALTFFLPETRDSVLRGFDHRPIIVGGVYSVAADGVSVASGSAQIAASYALAGVGIAIATGTAALIGSVALSAAGASFSAGTAAAVAGAELIVSGLSECAGQAYLAVDALLVAFGVADCLGSAALLRRDNRINYLNQKSIMVISNNNLFVRF